MIKKLIISAVVIVLMAGYLFFRSGSHVNYDLPELKTPAMDEISRITYGIDDENLLVKKDDHWFLSGDSSKKLDDEKMKEILQQIASLEATDLISDSGMFKQYGLEDDEKKVTVSSSDKDLSFDFGRKSDLGNRSFGAFPGDKCVYLITGDWNKLLPGDVVQLRDKSVLTFDKESIDKIVLRDNVLDSTRTFEKGEDHWTENGDPLDEESSVLAVLTTLSDFHCQTYSSAEPEGDIHWNLSLSAKDECYRIYAWDNSENRLLCRSSQAEDPFYVGSAVLAEVEKLLNH